MKRAILCCYLSLFNLSLDAAIPTQTAHEVRPSVGSDTLASGCFVVGSTGTDYSQQNAAQYTGTDLVIDGATNTKVTSATHNFVATDVGNCLQITAGTGFTAGVRYIVSVAANAATLDASAGTLGSTGGTFAVGGAFATLTKALTVNTAGNVIWVKDTGTITTTTTITLNNTQTPLASVPLNRLQGYTTTRGDSGHAHIALSTNSSLTGLDAAPASGWYIANIDVDCANLTGSNGITTAYYSQVYNSTIANCKGTGAATAGTNVTFRHIEVTGASGTVAVSLGGQYNRLIDSNIHDNTTTAIQLVNSDSAVVEATRITNNTGASSDCILANSTNNDGGVTIRNNTFYNCGRDGIRVANFFLVGSTVQNNIFDTMGGCGINATVAGIAYQPGWDGNAYRANTGGTLCGFDTGPTNPVNASPQYTNAFDVSLSVSPFTSAGGNDFTLNNTAGGGAAVRGSGIPGTLPGSGGIGYMPMGALAPASCASAGTVTTACGFVQ